LNFSSTSFWSRYRDLALSNTGIYLGIRGLAFIFEKKTLKKNSKECLVSTFPNMSVNCFGDIMIVYMLLLFIVVIVWKSGNC